MTLFVTFFIPCETKFPHSKWFKCAEHSEIGPVHHIDHGAKSTSNTKKSKKSQKKKPKKPPRIQPRKPRKLPRKPSFKADKKAENKAKKEVKKLAKFEMNSMYVAKES